MSAYYNEIDEYAAQWLRNLIDKGLIAPGDVDTRSIEDVRPEELKQYTQCHFFAGIGIWSLALRNAGWPDDRPVWTGSAPCQPFSSAGKGCGVDDERHLWPIFAELIEACRPPVVFGEQVASNLVTGRSSNAHLQRLWGRKATLGIFSDWLEENISLIVQGVSKQNSEGATSNAQGLDSNSGFKTGGRCQVEGCAERTPIRSNCRLGSEGARFGCLRSYGHSLRHDCASGVEYPVAGSDTSGLWLSEIEHSGGLVRLKRSLQDMGGEPSYRDGERHYETPHGAIQRTAAEIDRELDAQNGGAWIDTLQHDLEGMGYAVGAVPFPSASVGAPHIRDRLYWVADAAGIRFDRWRAAEAVAVQGHGTERGGQYQEPGVDGELPRGPQGLCRHGRRVSDTDPQRLDPNACSGLCQDAKHDAQSCCGAVWLGHAIGTGLEGHPGHEHDRGGPGRIVTPEDRPVAAPGCTNGFWRDCDWLPFRDGKIRPIEPGTFPLVDGNPTIVGRLRAYGNAINAVQAEEFIRAWLACRPE